MVRIRPARLRPLRLRQVRQHFQPGEKLSAPPRPRLHHNRLGGDIQTETTGKHTFVSASDTF